MDQRRLFLFLSLCFVLIILFGPKPKPPEQNPEQADQAVAQADADGAGQDAAAPADGDAAPDGDVPAADDEAAAPVADVDADLQYVTLGSVDPASAYRLGVTLTNHGAGVRRIELPSPRFRDLHDRGGYAGHLELAPDVTGGLRIQSLVAGSPAAQAGLEVGDRLISITGTDGPVLLSAADVWTGQLNARKPGEKLTVQVVRGEQPPTDKVISLRRRPLEVIRPEAENVYLRADEPEEEPESPPSFQLTFEQLNALKIPAEQQEIVGVALRDTNWEVVTHDATSATFRKTVPQHKLEVVKVFRLQPVPADSENDKNFPGYHLTLDIQVRNLDDKAIGLRYQLDGPNGLPVEGWWYANKASGTGIRDVMARYVGGDTPRFSPTDIANGKIESQQGPPLAYAGVDAQYFAVMLMPEKPTLETKWIDELRSISLSPKPKARSSEGRYANVTCQLVTQQMQLAAGETLEQSYKIFAGPKRPDLLANYQANETTQYSLGDLLYYGWFGPVSKTMLAILHFFYGIVGNYGIAIILLTVLVRGCMFPISRKQAQSMARMQELRPEMERIKEKYKQDMQKQSQAMQELYRKYNINPLAGCLPMFLQLPIFIGLYRSLMVDVELRQAPLISEAIRWCSNLAAPDMLYDWSWLMPEFINRGEGIFGLGPYLNILPLVTIALMILQQKMFMPEAANEQAALQQKIMKYMMVFMGFIFYKVASGLCLYFIASSLWGIAERKLLPKPAADTGLASADSKPPTNISPYTNGADKDTRRRTSNKSKKKKR